MNYTIDEDLTAPAPNEWADTNLFIVAKHPDFYVPEPNEKSIPEDPDEVTEKYVNTHWIFDMEAYIHSGVHLSLAGKGNYPDRRWDVSQLGFVFVSKEEWSTEAEAKEAAIGLIDSWNMYNSGDVWGYTITDDEDNEVDSCWGMYGHDYCEQEAKDAMASLVASELVA